MPTLRKRIGFLPKSEVQTIIEKICIHNKLSQSKVTGILVEEALKSRGVLNTKIKPLVSNFIYDDNENLLTDNKLFKSELPNEVDNINSSSSSINDEVQMINDYIEFKFFKNIMNKNKRRNNL